MKRLYEYIRPCAAGMAFAILCKGIGALTDLLIPYLMGVIINTGIAGRDVSMVVRLCLLMLGVAAVTVGANLLANYMGAYQSQKIGDNIRNAFYGHIQEMTIGDVEQVTTASLITRVTNDVEYVQRMLLMLTRFMIRGPMIAIGGTVLSLLIDPWLTLIMFAAMILLAGASFSVYKVTRPLYRKVQKYIDRMTSVLRENLEGVRVVKAFNKAGYELERFDRQSREVRKNEVKAGTINAFMGPTMALISGVTTAVILYVGGFRLDGGEIRIGDVVTILNYINMTLMAMAQIPRMFMMFSRANTSAARIAEILDIKDSTAYGEATKPADSRAVLEFDRVSFTYPGAERPVLENISFRLMKGETLAVIGGTGSGKTTLLNLVLRLYEPTEGTIRFEGRDIAEYDRKTLTRRITAAMQQYNIFGMSVRDNITLDLDYDEERLSRSAESAQIMEMIEELDGQFDYEIAQDGTNLSGGQKQRISVARTLYRKSGLVILDDVSSALDYRTDLRLRSALRKNYRGTSVILISQRISAVRNADRILVLKKGRIMGLNTHEQLLNGCEAYREICATQGVTEETEKEGQA